MCSRAFRVRFKVLGWESTALDGTKKTGQLDYKKMGGQVFARAGVWPRDIKIAEPEPGARG